jgi:hypothetical protein
MTSIRNRRAIGALATLLAAAAIALAMALSAPGTDPAAGAQHHHAAQAAKARSLHDVMRKLWEDHITWTRLAIVSFAHDLPDLPQTQARLLRNQTDIGNAVKH